MLRFRLNFGAGTHYDTAASGFECITYAAYSVNESSGGEIRGLDILHKLFNGNIRIVNHCHTAIENLCKVMRRHIGCHTYGYSRRAVHKQIWNAGRKNCRLLLLIVIVGYKINGVLVYVLHHLFAYFPKAYFGVTHCSRTVTVNRTEIALTVNQRITHYPILRKSHKCTIY